MKDFNFTKFVFFNNELNDSYEHLIYKGYERDLVAILKSQFTYISETDCLACFKDEPFNTIYFDIDNENLNFIFIYKDNKWKEYLQDYVNNIIADIKIFEKQEKEKQEYNHSFIRIRTSNLDFFDRLDKKDLKSFIVFLMKKYKLNKLLAFLLFKESLKKKELMIDISCFFNKEVLIKLYKNNFNSFETIFYNDMFNNWINFKKEYINA